VRGFFPLYSCCVLTVTPTEEQVLQQFTRSSHAHSNLHGSSSRLVPFISHLPFGSLFLYAFFIEIDPTSFTHAQKNVDSNELVDRICVMKVEAVNEAFGMQGQQEALEFGFDSLFKEFHDTDLSTDHKHE
jgi:hypothetical protein